MNQVAVSFLVNRLQLLPARTWRYPSTCGGLRDAESRGWSISCPDETVLYPERRRHRERGVLAGTSEAGPAGFSMGRDGGAELLTACSRASGFGKKDYQQLMVVRALVRQLDLPVAIEAGETVREADGLAMSSRNAYLSAAERAEAPRLYRLLRKVASGTASGTEALDELAGAGWKPDYVEVRRRRDLAAPDRATGSGWSWPPPGSDRPF